MRAGILLAALVALAAGMAGCGYNAGYVARGDISRVAVPVFANDTFYREIEVDLTQQVVNQIEKRTPYTLSDSSSADAILEGRVKGYTKTVLAEDTKDNPIDLNVVLTVEVTLKDARTGAVIKTENIRVADDFVQSLGETETTARTTLFERAAYRIVERVFEHDW